MPDNIRAEVKQMEQFKMTPRVSYVHLEEGGCFYPKNIGKGRLGPSSGVSELSLKHFGGFLIWTCPDASSTSGTLEGGRAGLETELVLVIRKIRWEPERGIEWGGGSRGKSTGDRASQLLLLRL